MDNETLVNDMMEAHGEVLKLRSEVQQLREQVAWYERQLNYIRMLADMAPKEKE